MLVIKRDGQELPFNESKIFQALLGAFSEVDLLKEGHDNKHILDDISSLVEEISENIKEDGFEAISVESIQDYVIDALLESDYPKVAKAYIQFAERRKVAREAMPANKTCYPKVRKKSGRVEPFNRGKLVSAINAAAPSKLSVGAIEEVVLKIVDKVEKLNKETITTDELHDLVEEQLTLEIPEVYEQYAIYRRYKKNMSKSYDAARQDSERILYGGDNENANRDAQLNSTKQTLTAESFMKRLVRDFEINPEMRRAHDEGWLYIHDIGARYLRQQNCCLFDMSSLLKGGFEMNGTKYLEPKYITSAMAVLGDATLQASGQQFGGFTVPEIDTVLAPYAEKSYKNHLTKLVKDFGDIIPMERLEQKAESETLRDIRQGVQGLETKMNTVSSSLGQVPFLTFTFGLNTSRWAREITKAFLENRLEGLGENKTTAVFPKLVMLMRKEINRDTDSPNRDIYDLAIECSKKRLYPDYLSLDTVEGNTHGEAYDRSKKVISPMGCRAMLSPYWRGSEEIYTGRGNLGAVTLNLPKIAIESNGSLEKFYETIDNLTEMIWGFHLSYMEKVGKQKGSTNPLLYCEGGAWKTVGYNDEIAPILEAYTSSLGFIGVEEAVKSLTGKPLLENQELGLEIVQHLKNSVNEATEKYGKLFALYATPAESLCYTFSKLNKSQYGEIEGVTDREYLTNSFHIPVWENITVPQKIAFESPFHKISTGGRIAYNEFPYGTPNEVLEEAIDFAMNEGLYYGVNIISSTCLNCNNSGDFRDDCPMCGCSNVVTISRVCGYLSYEKTGSDTESRFNKGKQKEVLDRVKHYTRGLN